MDYRDVIDLLMDWLAPQRCIVCNEIIEGDEILCDVCKPKWESEKRCPCEKCGRPSIECECGLEAASPLVDRLTLGVCHLGWYAPGDKTSAGNLLTYEMKTRDYARLYRHIGGELARRVSRFKGVGENTIVTYVPRTRKNVREYGMDQSERLAKYVARYLGLPKLKTLVNVSRKLQKELDHNERYVNASTSYRLSKDADGMLRGKTVILIDDIITTGASMLSAAEILAENGASGLIFASVLKTQKPHEARKSFAI